MKLACRIVIVLTCASALVSGPHAGSALAGADEGRLYYSRATLPYTEAYAVTSPAWVIYWPSTIYSIRPDGTQESQLMPGDTPKISPDGRYLAYEEDGDIWVARSNGSSPGRRVLVTSNKTEFWPSWSPDGKRLAFIQWDLSGDTWFSAVVTINVDGTGFRRVTDSPTPLEQAPAWSPDGRWIVFTRVDAQEPERVRHIYLVRPDGSHLRRLTHGRLSAWRPRWSPDSRHVVFGGVIQNNRNGVTTYHDDIYVVSVNGGEATKVTEGMDADSTPCWSPDGKRIAFSRQVIEVEQWSDTLPYTYAWTGTPADLYSVAIDGSDLRQITNTPQASEHECDWSTY